jgi:hypothetical protein
MRKPPVMTYSQAQQIIDFNNGHEITGSTALKPAGLGLIVATLTLVLCVGALLH